MANETTQKTDFLLNEIIAADKMYNYQDWSPSVTVANFNQDPSVVWTQLFYNPWLAQAIFEDMDLRVFRSQNSKLNHFSS